MLYCTIVAWEPTLAKPRCFFYHLRKMIWDWSMRFDFALLVISTNHQRTYVTNHPVIVFMKLQSSSSPGQLAQSQCWQAEFSGSLPALEQFCKASFPLLTPLGWPELGDLIPATTDILSIISRNPMETRFLKYHVQDPSSFCTGVLVLLCRTTGSSGRYLVWAAEGSWEKLPSLGQGKLGNFTHTFPCKVAQ